MRRVTLTALAWLLLLPTAGETQVLASVWYRGVPSGVPRSSDLEEIKASGFNAVTWPLHHVTGADELQRMASRLQMKVVVRSESVPLTLENVTDGDAKVDLWVARTPRSEWTSLLWRAVAHGTRTVSFDAGLPTGTGLRDEASLKDWVAVAATLGRQLTSNASLIASLRRGPAVTIDPADALLDLSLLENARSWVIIATNASSTSGRSIDTYATFPAAVPAAEWLGLFDGNMMSMLYRSTGSRWHVRLGPGEAKVFVIDKREFEPSTMDPVEPGAVKLPG